MTSEKNICISHNKSVDLSGLFPASSRSDTVRWYTNRQGRPCWPAFLVKFPAIRFGEEKPAPAAPPDAAARDVHYPQAPDGKAALNDSLVMTIGGTRYTVKSIFSENGGDFREMFEAAVVSRAARSLSDRGAAPVTDMPQAAAFAGGEA